jgi:hypothetical protein
MTAITTGKETGKVIWMVKAKVIKKGTVTDLDWAIKTVRETGKVIKKGSKKATGWVIKKG